MNLRGQTRREFPQSVRKAAFARCCRQCLVPGVTNRPGIPQCENCGNELHSGNIEYEHLVPDGLGGEPTLDNCGVWCRKPCSSAKTAEIDIPTMAKADRALRKNYGLGRTKAPFKSRGFKRAGAQNRASGEVKKWRGYVTQ